MEWRGRRQSRNVEDRRGSRGGSPFGRGGGIRMPSRGIRVGRGGGGSILALIVVGAILFMMGINPLALLDDGSGSYAPSQTGQVTTGSNDEMKQFVSTVLAETEDVWHSIMESQGQAYPEPSLVLFSGAVRSACGSASSAMGPFYCPVDEKVYIDLDFYDELARRFGASGDFAQAYVLAHEVGHHVQNIIGVLPQFNRMREQMTEVEANQMSVRVELQADCFAGIWAHFTAQKGLLETGDLEEALNAARQIGDDTLQKRTQGYVVPDSFNHGTSAQRMTWFKKGYDSGRLSACDTFNNPV
ncbi:KPN_02809 family neutral zinc metallopeptidase [Martelella limonii]|uniref:KPN_02809 family neutral zinc metallopeptidase n=1 Tax=Martelella limonii TaxID=1647649 RepID=UPI001580BC33|nr:neutral zinc metallopeptidase [Martelella limonii]